MCFTKWWFVVSPPPPEICVFNGRSKGQYETTPLQRRRRRFLIFHSSIFDLSSEILLRKTCNMNERMWRVNVVHIEYFLLLCIFRCQDLHQQNTQAWDKNSSSSQWTYLEVNHREGPQQSSSTCQDGQLKISFAHQLSDCLTTRQLCALLPTIASQHRPRKNSYILKYAHVTQHGYWVNHKNKAFPSAVKISDPRNRWHKGKSRRCITFACICTNTHAPRTSTWDQKSSLDLVGHAQMKLES